MVNYTTSTVDSPEYKSLICGRLDDVTKLLSHLVNAESVAIFGERRIGKTSLLYLTRDIINRTIRHYEGELIDVGFKDAIIDLEAKVEFSIAIYLNLQNLDTEKAEAFSELICREVRKDTWLGSAVPSDIGATNSTLAEIFEAVHRILKDNNKRLVILIDEVEILLEISNGKQIFRNLRGIIQSCPRIRFVFAGAEYWYKQIKDRTSPIVNNVKTFYLKSPARFAIENYLIKSSFLDIFNSPRDVDIATEAILGWCDCKPYYVQAACQVVIEFYENHQQQFSSGWQNEVEKKIEEFVKPQLDYFYENENLHQISKEILALLANYPGLTIKQISNKLGYSSRTVCNFVDDLESLEQIRKQGSEYYLVGKLIENWGRKTQEIKIRNQWSQGLKWMFSGIFILSIPLLYFYTNPKTARFSCSIPKNLEVFLEMPKSLEMNEEGTANIAIKNKSLDTIQLITVTLESRDIQYKHKTSNSSQFKIKNLDMKATKYEEMKFTAGESISGKVFTSNLLLKIENTQLAKSCSFSFKVLSRKFPVKRYLLLINSLLLILGSILAKENLFKLAPGIITSLL